MFILADHAVLKYKVKQTIKLLSVTLPPQFLTLHKLLNMNTISWDLLTHVSQKGIPVLYFGYMNELPSSRTGEEPMSSPLLSINIHEYTSIL